jgi:plastocyanin
MKHVPSFLTLSLIAAFVVLAMPSSSYAQADSASETVVVKMVDKGGGQWRFDPETIRVPQGGVVRFVQDDTMPHNVEFTSSPKGAKLDAIRMGPFLTQPGQTYEVTIDERFPLGDYPYICTPHVALGMTGTLTVVRPGATRTSR